MPGTRATHQPTKKQAVVVIHGMGEQRPMETIRAFVSQVWKHDKNLDDPHFWSKPSSVSASFEQRRLTTDTPTVQASSTRVQRTDFFEYYWAHHTVGTKWEHFVGWISTLLLCKPSRYDAHASTLRPLWFILWSIILAGVLLGALWENALSTRGVINEILASVLSVVWLFIVAKARQFFTQYFGDVARYVQAKPANIGIRQAIRSGGVSLLERIQQTGDYDRIVLVGHSLGSIVAYDILTHLWARHNKFKTPAADGSQPTPLSPEIKACLDELTQLAADAGNESFNQQAYWDKQRALFAQLSNHDPDNNWLISDFITLGSPLTYADILLLKDQQSFVMRKLDRELPTSPPVTEDGKWYYGSEAAQFLHHGAVFAPVKWTNIYMPHEHFIKGDLISGPVSRNFSYASFDNKACTMLPPKHIDKTPIQEIALNYRDVRDGFTHTAYWAHSDKSDRHLEILRKSVALYPPDSQ